MAYIATGTTRYDTTRYRVEKRPPYSQYTPVLLALSSVDLQQSPDTLAYTAPSLSPNGTASTVRQEVLQTHTRVQNEQNNNRTGQRKGLSHNLPSFYPLDHRP